MKFHFETEIMLEQGFDIEAANPKEAMQKIEKYVLEEADLNAIGVSAISFNFTDPSYRAYTKEHCMKRLEKMLEEENAAAKPKPEEENAAAAKPKRVRKNKKDKEDPK